MKHLDEGTIHAWLDGALSDAEAREVSGHVASCAECAAKVAEARGFIAGASRILTALDDVPAGISPKQAPVTSVKPQRFWQAAPWVTGIAAALMLAVGVKEWRDRPSAQIAIAPARILMDSLRSALPEPTPVDSTLRLRAVSAPQPKALHAPSPAELRRRVAGTNAAASGAGVAGAPAPMRDARKDAVEDRVAPVASASALKLEAVPVTGGREPHDERQLAGCYRVEPDMAVRGTTVKSIAKAASATADATSATQNAPRAGLAAPAAPAEPLASPSIVRLDTTFTPRGRIIRRPLTGEAIGNWYATGGDSVRLVIPASGARTVAQSSRVACPTTPEQRP